MIKLNKILKSIFCWNNYFLICFIIFTPHLPFYCQSSKSLLDVSKEWSTIFWSDANGKYYTIKYKLSGDTIINNNDYFKVFGNFNEEIPNNWSLNGFIREDSTNKVYFKHVFFPDECLLYDFNLNLSDTLDITCHAGGKPYEQIEIYISSIDTILINNQKFKTYLLRTSESNLYSNKWIESIGSLHGLLTNIYPIHYDGAGGYELLCFKVNDTLYYQNPKYETCFYTTAYSNIIYEKSTEIIIYPNPVTDKSILKVIGMDHEKTRVEIYDAMGNKLITNNLMENQISLYRFQFEPGIYIYKIIKEGDFTNIGKFIVN